MKAKDKGEQSAWDTHSLRDILSRFPASRQYPLPQIFKGHQTYEEKNAILRQTNKQTNTSTRRRAKTANLHFYHEQPCISRLSAPQAVIEQRNVGTFFLLLKSQLEFHTQNPYDMARLITQNWLVKAAVHGLKQTHDHLRAQASCSTIPDTFIHISPPGQLRLTTLLHS